MITRRQALTSLLALPVALEAATVAHTEEPAHAAGPILGSTVFHWNEMKAVKNEKGEVRTLCKTPTATIDQLEMHITTLNPGQASHAPHTHVNEELIILREGVVETLSKGVWVRVEAGSVIFNASNDLHALRNVGTTPATYHVINYSPDRAKLKS